MIIKEYTKDFPEGRYIEVPDEEILEIESEEVQSDG